MAATISFSGSATWKRLCHKQSAKPNIVHLAIKTTCHFGQNKLETHQNASPRERNIENKTKRAYPLLASKRGTTATSSPLSPSETVKGFYACINDGGLKGLQNYISAHCYIEECSFSNPFQGQKEVLSFFEQLIAGMGQNVKFRVKQVCEADGLIAAANWHLEWKEKEIPFTRGCSFFECSKEGENLVIKKAQIVIESPVKPGHLVLVLLKIVTTLFDNYPKAAEWFLKSPYVILHWLFKIYSIFFAIFINAAVKSYIHIWNLATTVYSYAYQIILHIQKMFVK